ncbi:uncharacterized protein P884DRAFT_332042 [Thermothelomyces heterothallicus CBS 202.75]|uniref:uncharacterized protein n=1 Tax=Thermothelomyces heterothallicus CBS 202.75 TaxID=1149848 RepID=UPI003742D567
MEHTRRTADAVVDLPSYRAATTRPDWLALVAPYVRINDYASLCLVSRHFYRQFAPRLWNDPLAVMHPGCLIRFMRHVKTRVRATTPGNLVRSFDTRWVSQSYDYAVFAHAGIGGAVPLSSLLLSIASSFPRLRCILLDGYPNLAHEPPGSPLTPDQPPPFQPPFEPPLLLSTARCQVALPPSFFASPYLKSLVYLDVSDMPGSLRHPLAQRTLSPANLPGLRILKLRGREMDDATATLLFKTFGEQLWSLDLSRNKLTDDALDALNQFSFPSQTSRTDHYSVEGRIASLLTSSPSFGTFCTVTESEWSADFSHPHRHIADPPCYIAHDEAGPHPTIAPRLDGRVKILPDSADAVKAMLSGGVGSHSPPLESVQIADVCRAPHGITHLYLSSNNVSAEGLSRTIRSSPGQLQRLECDSVSFKLPDAAPPSWLSKARLSGALGCAHLFRPVFSANLQVLRIHHSVVTQLLTLSLDRLSPMANMWVAETQLLPRAELAYPEAFVPDMNPRLQSLVLTRIPRYSTGPLIDKLIAFLKLASIQERAIQDTKSASRHGPVTLLGLRHIRLEFDPDPLEDLPRDNFGLELGFDAAAVMEDATKEFSFFGDSGWSSVLSTDKAASRATPPNDPEPEPNPRGSESEPTRISQSARSHPPHPASSVHAPAPVAPATVCPDETSVFPRHPDHYHHDSPEWPKRQLNHVRIPHSWTWHKGAAPLSALVWAGYSSDRQEEEGAGGESGEEGSGDRDDGSAPPAVREYARLLRAHPQLRCDPVPATPCHVRAGVPPGELLFGPAWASILCPPPSPSVSATTAAAAAAAAGASGPAVPTRQQLRGMRDVVKAIKEYRARTRQAYEAAKKEAEARGEQVRWGPPHFHWGGRLEVEVDGAGAYHQSRYWR